LIHLRREIERSRPIGPVDRLTHQLDLAISLEDYEEAARIRDQIARLRGDSAPSGTKAARPS
jgi:protein-arginine kinase activator protein McsA